VLCFDIYLFIYILIYKYSCKLDYSLLNSKGAMYVQHCWIAQDSQFHKSHILNQPTTWVWPISTLGLWICNVRSEGAWAHHSRADLLVPEGATLLHCMNDTAATTNVWCDDGAALDKRRLAIEEGGRQLQLEIAARATKTTRRMRLLNLKVRPRAAAAPL
jgi:hypothetical protein